MSLKIRIFFNPNDFAKRRTCRGTRCGLQGMYLKGVYNGTWKSGPRICYYISIISVDIAKSIVFLQLERARLGLDFHGSYIYVFYRQSVIFGFRCIRKSIFYYYTSSKKRSETAPAGFGTYIVVSSTNCDISNGFWRIHMRHNVLLYAYKNNELKNQHWLRHRLVACACHVYFHCYMHMISNTGMSGSGIGQRNTASRKLCRFVSGVLPTCEVR